MAASRLRAATSRDTPRHDLRQGFCQRAGSERNPAAALTTSAHRIQAYQPPSSGNHGGAQRRSYIHDPGCPVGPGPQAASKAVRKTRSGTNRCVADTARARLNVRGHCSQSVLWDYTDSALKSAAGGARWVQERRAGNPVRKMTDELVLQTSGNRSCKWEACDKPNVRER